MSELTHRRSPAPGSCAILFAAALGASTSVRSLAQESGDGSRTPDSWKSLLARTRAVAYRSREVRPQTGVADFGVYDALTERADYLMRDGRSAELSEWLRLWKEVTGDGRPHESLEISVERTARGWVRTSLSPRQDGNPPTRYLTGPTVSAAVSWAPFGDVASISGPLPHGSPGMLSNDPLLSMRGTGLEFIADHATEIERGLAGEAAFLASVARGDAIAEISKTNSRAAPGEKVITGASCARFLRDVTYLPVHAESSETSGDVRLGAERLWIQYGREPLLPRVIARVGARADVVGAKCRLSLDVVVLDGWREVADGTDLRLKLSSQATIEDRSTGEVFSGSAEQPGRWPEHWRSCFVPPATASPTPGPTYGPRERTGRREAAGPAQRGGRGRAIWIAGVGLGAALVGWCIWRMRRPSPPDSATVRRGLHGE